MAKNKLGFSKVLLIKSPYIFIQLGFPVWLMFVWFWSKYTGSHSVGRTHCVKLVHRLYPEVDPALNTDHVEHMLHKCPDAIPDPKAVQYVRNDRGTPMILDNNYYRNILDNKGLLIVDHQLATDKRTKPYVKKMAKSQDYFFKEFSRAITILSENNPLTGTKGEIRKQCSVVNKHH